MSVSGSKPSMQSSFRTLGKSETGEKSGRTGKHKVTESKRTTMFCKGIPQNFSINQ